MDLKHKNHQLYLGNKTLIEAFRQAFRKDGRTMARLERDCGIIHPGLAAVNYNNIGYKVATEKLLIAFLEMGYKIKVEAP